MGWSLSWAALKGSNLETVCSALGLRSTGKREEIAESKIVGAALPTGWCVVVFNRTEIKDKTLEKLSQSGEAIGCFIEEHVMFSSASAWKNGKQTWRVEHNGEEDKVLHLEASGNLPTEFENVRKKAFAKQETTEHDDVDYVFDIPVELAKELTGFRHDQDVPGMSGDTFEVLEPAGGSGTTKAGSLLNRLFGKKEQS